MHHADVPIVSRHLFRRELTKPVKRGQNLYPLTFLSLSADYDRLILL